MDRNAFRRLLFVSVPMHGHINPLVEPARLLIKQGHAVLFVGYAAYSSTLAAAGVPFHSLGPDHVVDQQQHSQVDPCATKKSKMLASAALFTGVTISHLCLWHPHTATLHPFQDLAPNYAARSLLHNSHTCIHFPHTSACFACTRAPCVTPPLPHPSPFPPHPLSMIVPCP
jgi:hypothetical protein